MGKLYDSTVVNMPPNNELPVYPMTSIDEIVIRTPDALFNGAAMVDLIKSCIPNIIDPWKLNSIDIDAIIIAIRAASTDGNMDIESTCPSCEEVSTYGVSLLTILAEQRDVNFNEVQKLRDLEIKFRPLLYSEMNKNNMAQFEVQRLMVSLSKFEDTEEQKNQMVAAMTRMDTLVNEIVGSTIEYVKTPETIVTDKKFIYEFLVGCDKKSNEAIRQQSIKMREANEMKPFKLKCIACNHEYSERIVLNSTDFFG
jgi:hypothetical protein